MIHFSSDHHFGHVNVLKHSKRPYSSIEEMDRVLIENWNKVVAKTDTVWYLGDFSFYKKDKIEQIIDQLNGVIHYVRGNHDQVIEKKLKGRFASFQDYKHILVEDKDVPSGHQRIILSHYSFQVWNHIHRGAWNLYGHSHGNLKERKGFKACDIGVDSWFHAPVSYEHLKHKFSLEFYQNFQPIDHHQ